MCVGRSVPVDVLVSRAGEELSPFLLGQEDLLPARLLILLRLGGATGACRFAVQVLRFYT